MDVATLDRGRERVSGSRLGSGEWLVLAAAALFLLSMLALDWFALSVANQSVPDGGANAFESLDGADQVLVVAALAVIAGVVASAYGLVGAREAAVVTGAAGLLAALVVLYVIVSPPDVEGSVLEPYAGGIDARFNPRVGALLGLVLASGVVAGSARAIVRRPQVAAHVPQVVTPDEPAAADSMSTPKQATPPTTKPSAKKPKPKPAARKRAAQPKAAASKRATKAKAAPPATGRTRLATATARDLVAVGFTPTQAERIVKYRDEEAIVSKVADLKRVPGIAKPVLAELVKRLED